METAGVPAPGDEGQRKLEIRARWVASHGMGVGLILAVGVWLAISLWAAPVPASGVALKAAADGGRVTHVDRAESPPPPLSAQPLFPLANADPADHTGAILVWTTRDGHRYITDAATVPGPFPHPAGMGSDPSLDGDGANPSPADQVTTYVLERSRFQGEVVWAGLAQLGLLALAIGGIRGRVPRHGTRWFWFWVISLPLGLGVVWFALSERLRDRASVRQRWTGGQGLAVGLVGVPVIHLAVTGVRLLVTRM